MYVVQQEWILSIKWRKKKLKELQLITFRRPLISNDIIFKQCYSLKWYANSDWMRWFSRNAILAQLTKLTLPKHVVIPYRISLTLSIKSKPLPKSHFSYIHKLCTYISIHNMVKRIALSIYFSTFTCCIFARFRFTFWKENRFILYRLVNNKNTKMLYIFVGDWCTRAN